jgi:chromosome partitioning protein
MEIIAVVNQKGGVGKTTTSVNLAASFAAIGKKTLLIDLDPQGNASTGLGIGPELRRSNIYNLIIGRKGISSSIMFSNIANLDIIASVVDLAAAELEIRDFAKREYILKTALEQIEDEYDFVIIDCPPSLGLLTVNALVAAKKIVVPMQCEFFALEGLSNLLKTVQIVKRNLNQELEILGVLLTMYDRRNRLSLQVARDVKKYLGDKVFYTSIPRNIKVTEAPSFGKPAIAYDHTCSGSRAYIRLAKEILNKITKLKIENEEQRKFG